MSNNFLDNQGFVNTQGIERSWNSSIGTEATRNEFNSFMSGYGFAEADSTTLFDSFDVNGDSALSTAEFLDGLEGTNTNGGPRISAEEFETSTGVEIPEGEEDEVSWCDDEPSCDDDPCCDDDTSDDDSSDTPASDLFDSRGALDMDGADRMFESEAGDEATRGEFNDVLSAIGIEVEDEEAAFGAFDVNGDGAVSRSEFLDGLMSADTNDSGSVIREELEGFLNP